MSFNCGTVSARSLRMNQRCHRGAASLKIGVIGLTFGVDAEKCESLYVGQVTRVSARVLGRMLFSICCCVLAHAQEVKQVPAPPFTSKLSAEEMAAYRKLAEEKLHTDWADLQKYRDANRALSVSGNSRIVFMGDSITENWGEKNNPFFSDLGEFFPGHCYINRGISGQTSPQMLVRFRQDVIDLNPSIVVLLTGTNDIAGARGPMTLEQSENNIRSMVELAHIHHISVILCSVTPAKTFWWAPSIEPGSAILALNSWLKSYAAARHLSYVDYYSVLVDHEGGMRSGLSHDGVHPNSRGYAVMTPLVERAIVQATVRKSVTNSVASKTLRPK